MHILLSRPAPGHSLPPFDGPQILEQFRAALIARDIVPPEPILADGRLHRCNAAGRHGRGDAAYLLHLDGIPAGGLENWRDGRGWEQWRCDTTLVLTNLQRSMLLERVRADQVARDREQQHRHATAQAIAARLWAASRPAPPDHPYLVRKGVQPLGLRVFKGALVVPVRDMAGTLHSLQFISPGGIKRFLRGGRIRGLGFWIGSPPGCEATDKPILVAEGFATGASLHEASGHPVVVAFHAGNLESLARAVRVHYPGAPIVVCADDDHRKPGNPGLAHAHTAALAVGGLLARPDFGEGRPPEATDFNDLHQLRGVSAVRTALASASLPRWTRCPTRSTHCRRCCATQ